MVLFEQSELADPGLGIVSDLDVPMPMRDGVALRANIYRPDAPGQFPAILERTPYGKRRLGGNAARLVRAGYIVVTQDVRGRYASEGEYRSLLGDPTYERLDGYDSVEWIADRSYCDGQVGVYGHSAGALNAWLLAGLQPPHLRAICPSSIPLEKWDVDWTFGSFRPARRINWLRVSMAPDLRRRAGSDAQPQDKAEAARIWRDMEHAIFLGMRPWSELVNHLPPELARDFEAWLRNPGARLWKLDEAHRRVEVPQLSFSGWFDHCSGVDHLAGMQENGGSDLARAQAKLIIGPWSHGTIGSRHVAGFDFGPDAELDKTDIHRRWFDRWLKGIDNGIDNAPAVQYFVMGANQWKSADTWPPPAIEHRELFLASHGTPNPVANAGELGAAPPAHNEPDVYEYNPHNPVPTIWDEALSIIPADRRNLEYRPDILYYCTPPLREEIEIAGRPEVVLFAASSARDTDFFARLVDDDPDGPALEIAHGLVRARHRHGLDTEDLLTPNEITEFRIRMTSTACRFRMNHRIRLEVTSSDFPNYDRNHNTGGNDLFEVEMIPARQQVFHDLQRPSRLILPITSAPSTQL